MMRSDKYMYTKVHLQHASSLKQQSAGRHAVQRSAPSKPDWGSNT